MNTQMEGFTVPHSIEAEQSVLGGLLIDNGAIDRLGELEESAFFSLAHRLIYSAIRKQSSAGKQWDVITVAEMLDAAKKLQEVGGLPYIGSLAANVPSSANIARYADIVRGHAMRREIMAAAAELTELAASKGGDIAVAMDMAQSRLLTITEGVKTDEPRSIAAIVGDHLNTIEKRLEGGRKGIATGLTALDGILNGGWHRGQVIVLAARPSMGKAQPLDSKVLKADGQWVRMGDLSIGDALASVDGSPSVVTGVFPQGRKKVLRVTFSDGRFTECCAEHLWSVSHRKWSAPKVMSTTEIAYLMSRHSMFGRLWVEPLSGDFGSDAQLPIDPWLLGALLGDGDFTQRTVRFSKTAEETIERVRSALPESVEMVSAGGCDYRLSVPRSCGATNPLMRSIRSLGLDGCSSADKFIPELYLSASRADRLNLLRGLLDTDGWVEKTGSVLYSTASLRLARNVQSLARSLGYWCSLNISPSHYTYKSERLRGLDQCRLVLSGANLDDLFLFEAKRTRCTNRARRKRIAFESIVPTVEAVCQCISVSHQSHLYVTDNYIVTHNTALSLHNAIEAAQAGYGVLYLSMEMRDGELADRAIAALGRVYLGNVLTGNMNPAEWDGVTAAVGLVQNLPLHILDRSGLNFYQVATFARRHKRKHGLDLLVVDYLQLMAGADGEKRHAQIEEITRNLKTLAKELDVAVLLLSQLSRKTEESRRPKLSHLRDSGSIEQDADVVLFIHREEVDNPETQWKNYADIHVAKNRQGALGRVGATYIGHQVRFENFDGVPPDWDAKPVSQTKGGYK